MIVQFEEFMNKLKELKSKTNEMGLLFDLDTLKIRLSEYENRMQEPDFWNDTCISQEITQKSKIIKDKIEGFNEILNRTEDLEMLVEMSIEEEDDSAVTEIKSEIKFLEKDIESIKIKTMLSGEYDSNNAILNLHVGVGGNDAQDWTEMLYRMYRRWCERRGFKIEILDLISADEAGIKGVTLRVIGQYAYGYLKAERGIHRLVRISPYNANGKRQTSFASVEALPELNENQDIEIKSDDLKIDTYRSSGAGGQHVNKTESAIRITHLPTGIVVQCQNERSQHSNKETAMKILKSKLVELKERAHKEKIEDLTGELKDNGWGSQIRSYVFHPYNLVKDHRTGVENSNTNAVMDGDIDEFIYAYLALKE
ncbi:peptide chain release factor 2 [Haloimpatiens sp. FM7315]|uniref:peptide chain release factor 2 n=1 Tax=Haloimpatiens sp. FM7315 TaxID=3298609 RepID=UPI00370BD16E